MAALDPVIAKEAADLVFVQGDTTSVLVGAIAAYYHNTKVAHLEAGLRSGDLYSPFPEEMNRKLVGQIASYHFAPTMTAVDNLAREGVTKNVYLVGNTVIDALKLGLGLIKTKGDDEYRREFGFLDPSKRVILVTGHRRESFGGGLERICGALSVLAATYPDIQIVYPVHLNPKVQEPVRRILGALPTVHLIEPIGYPSMLWLLDKSAIVLTDSGGIQEEAPALGKPVLVMRDKTERIEGIEAGTAILVGTDQEKIVTETRRLLDDAQAYKAMARAVNPYGDGTTSERILKILAESI
jgi:UDP-N-acetylglucosamine 2-epimerase (non-hydrolysing)